MRHERHRRDLNGTCSVAHHYGEFRAIGREWRFDIAHRDRRAEARTETAAGDAPDYATGLVDNLRTFARRHFVEHAKAYALALGAFEQLVHQALGRGEIARHLAALPYGKGEVGF